MKLSYKNKKGLSQISAIIILVIIVGLIVIIGFFLLKNKGGGANTNISLPRNSVSISK